MSFPDIDQRTLDRLADGELTAVEQRDLLQALGTSPGGWRRCALAFVEAQTWRQQFRGLSTDALHSPAATRSRSVSQKSPAARGSVSTAKRTRTTLAGAALAAALAIAFAAGWLTSLASQDGASTIVDAAKSSPEPRAADRPDAAVPAAPGNEPPRDALTLVVHDPQHGVQRIRVPLVEAEAFAGEFADFPAKPPMISLRQQLQQQGFDLQTRRRYAPLWIEQGNQLAPLVMPVDDAVVTPVGRVTF